MPELESCLKKRDRNPGQKTAIAPLEQSRKPSTLPYSYVAPDITALTLGVQNERRLLQHLLYAQFAMIFHAKLATGMILVAISGHCSATR